jgi:hypothetical protein
VFVRVAVCAALVVSTVWPVKVNEVGERLAPGAPDPVPVRLIICELPALSTMVMVPATVPVVVGVKVTVTLQAAPAATEDPQVLVCE